LVTSRSPSSFSSRESTHHARRAGERARADGGWHRDGRLSRSVAGRRSRSARAAG